MSHHIAPEFYLHEHDREARSLAMTARLVELAKCCKPSRVKAAVARVRERFSPAAPCCA
jgi:hypothetical protein